MNAIENEIYNSGITVKEETINTDRGEWKHVTKVCDGARYLFVFDENSEFVTISLI